MQESEQVVADRFEQLSLSPQILGNLAKIGYEKPTPIQAAFIPKALTGADCIGQAQTGTGKTAAFVLPILQAMTPRGQNPLAVVLAPTRELAVQIEAEASRLAHGCPVRIASLCGGHPMKRQLQSLRAGCDLVIGTPGRIIHHIRATSLRLGDVRFVVLDEADRMLDIGFRPDIERILRCLPHERQTMLLSATLAEPVRRLARKYMREPLFVDVAPTQRTVPSIRQSYITVDADRKFDLLLRYIDREQPTRCIVFCRRKRDAEFLAHDLGRRLPEVARMHGDLEQKKRDRIMESFRSGRVRFLVSTDLVGRGIDVDDISHVINFDIPDDPENYVHRIGRTARMGRDGQACTFVLPSQGPELTAIEMFVNELIARDEIDGFDAFRRLPAMTSAGSAAPRIPLATRRSRRRAAFNR